MPKVIIDCDPGIDDALALLLALASPELDIAGITTVSGNVPADIGAGNARKVLRQAGRQDIPVYIGEMLPLGGTYVDAMDTHGRDGLGESFLPEIPGEFPEKTAVKFLEETLEKEEISILALGPMTNLARLFQKRPELIGRITRLVSMGGSFRSHGNCSPVAEYNYWCDPEAAKACYQLFAEAGKKIEMVGLDVTREIVLTPNLVSYMERLDKKTGEFIRKITGFYMDFHWEYEGIIGCVINDPLAVAYMIDSSMCSGFDSFLDVETEGICRGQTVVDSMNFWKKKPNSHVLTETDAERFMSFFMSRILNKEVEQ
nr:nucleoside hydrolase [uncultured Mediterraneibacter sp.]